MLTRKQFIAEMDKVLRGSQHELTCDAPGHPLWAIEESEKIKCKWFVCVKPLMSDGYYGTQSVLTKQEFWDWTRECLTGKTICYMSDNFSREEWWGFTNKKDATLFVLRWS